MLIYATPIMMLGSYSRKNHQSIDRLGRFNRSNRRHRKTQAPKKLAVLAGPDPVWPPETRYFSGESFNLGGPGVDLTAPPQPAHGPHEHPTTTGVAQQPRLTPRKSTKPSLANPLSRPHDVPIATRPVELPGELHTYPELPPFIAISTISTISQGPASSN